MVDLDPVAVLGLAAAELELRVEQITGPELRRAADDHVAAPHLVDADAGEVERDSLPGGSEVERLVVHLHAAHACPAGARQQHDLVAALDLGPTTACP